MPVLCIDNRPMIAPLVDTADTIRSECHQALPVIVYSTNQGKDGGRMDSDACGQRARTAQADLLTSCCAADLYNGTLTGGVCCSLNANTGASANHAGPSLVLCFMGGQGAKARSLGLSEGTAPMLKSAPSGGNTVPDVCYRRTND